LGVITYTLLHIIDQKLHKAISSKSE